jgi:hypothetical protein
VNKPVYKVVVMEATVVVEEAIPPILEVVAVAVTTAVTVVDTTIPEEQ